MYFLSAKIKKFRVTFVNFYFLSFADTHTLYYLYFDSILTNVNTLLFLPSKKRVSIDPKYPLRTDFIYISILFHQRKKRKESWMTNLIMTNTKTKNF
jgi:hypothetical protein